MNSVCPDLAKFRNFGKIKIYLAIVKRSFSILAIFRSYSFGKFLILLGKVSFCKLTNNEELILVIWSHLTSSKSSKLSTTTMTSDRCVACAGFCALPAIIILVIVITCQLLSLQSDRMIYSGNFSVLHYYNYYCSYLEPYLLSLQSFRKLFR